MPDISAVRTYEAGFDNRQKLLRINRTNKKLVCTQKPDPVPGLRVRTLKR